MLVNMLHDRSCETEVRSRGRVVPDSLRYVTQGGKVKRYVSLHRGEGV